MKPETNPPTAASATASSDLATPASDIPPSNSGRALICVALIAGLAELSYAILNVSAMPVYLEQSMGYGAKSLALILTSFLFTEGLMKGPFGILGDRVGRKALILAGPSVSVVTSLLTLLIKPDQWYFFVALRVLDGLGAAALWPAALTMIADVSPPEKRSQSLSLFNVTYMVGIALGPFVGGVANDIATRVTHSLHLRSSFDPRHASFYVVSLIFLCTAIAAWRLIPDIRPHHETSPHDTEGGFTFAGLWQGLKQNPQMLLMAFVTFFGVGMIMPVIKIFAIAELALSETGFGALLLVPCLLIGVSSIYLGTLGDRLGTARATKLGIGMCAFSMWGLILLNSRITLVIGGSLIGLGFVIAFPAWLAHISHSCNPRLRGAVMGAVGTAQGLGAVIGTILGGILYDDAAIPLPFISEGTAKLLPFVHAIGGKVTLNPHYAPFIGCAGMLFISWLIATTAVKAGQPAEQKETAAS
jgi:MFS family permease